MWTNWISIGIASSRKSPLDDYGIYKIRIVDKVSNVIPIGRLNRIDDSGVLYIGRSGFRYQNTERTVANRLDEFLNESHSGGKTYGLASAVLKKSLMFSGHLLEAQALYLKDDEIEEGEAKELRDYFLNFAELPPLNSSFPKKGSFR